MADYEYKGVTAYVKENEYNEDRLRLLADALFPLQTFTDMERPLLKGADVIKEREDFQLLEEHAGYFCKEDFYFPQNTPVDYQNVSVSAVEIKGQKLTRLYFPVVSKRLTDEIVLKGLVPLLEQLYGRDLLTIKTKTALEFENFADGKEAVLISTDRLT